MERLFTVEEDEELGIERHAFGLSLPTMPRQTLVFELTMVQVLAEDAGAQSPIVDKEPDEAAEGEGVDRRGERRCQVRMQSALGDTRQDDPILRTGSMQIEVIAEEVEHPAYKHSKYGTTSQNSQKPQSLEDARAHQMGHRHPLEKASKHHSGDLHSPRLRVHQQASRQGVLRGKAQETFGNGPF